jgi:hypothetical protein
MQMQCEELPQGPPPGWRKAIPDKVKLRVVIRQDGKCATCGERLGTLEASQFDHVPAVQLRIWDPVVKDTVPPSNDVDSIFAKHIDCHAAKTFGSKASKRGADVTEIARTKRIAKDTAAFRQRMLAKTDPDVEVEQPKRSKKSWPKRPFQSRKGNDGARSNQRGPNGRTNLRHFDGPDEGSALPTAPAETDAEA